MFELNLTPFNFYMFILYIYIYFVNLYNFRYQWLIFDTSIIFLCFRNAYEEEIEHEDTTKRKLHELIPFDVERILVKTFFSSSHSNFKAFL